MGTTLGGVPVFVVDMWRMWSISSDDDHTFLWERSVIVWRGLERSANTWREAEL